jgi:hypothetical protein
MWGDQMFVAPIVSKFDRAVTMVQDKYIWIPEGKERKKQNLYIIGIKDFKREIK